MSRQIANFSQKLFVSNIPWNVSTGELLTYFRQFGQIKDIKIVFNKKTGFSKSYGFVQFNHPESLGHVERVDQHKLKGNVLYLSFNESESQRPKDNLEGAENKFRD